MGKKTIQIHLRRRLVTMLCGNGYLQGMLKMSSSKISTFVIPPPDWNGDLPSLQTLVMDNMQLMQVINHIWRTAYVAEIRPVQKTGLGSFRIGTWLAVCCLWWETVIDTDSMSLRIGRQTAADFHCHYNLLVSGIFTPAILLDSINELFSCMKFLMLHCDFYDLSRFDNTSCGSDLVRMGLTNDYAWQKDL